MKIVVIGGTGLIGTKLVHILREQGHEVVAGVAFIGRQHHSPVKVWRSAGWRSSGRRRGEFAFVRGQGGVIVLRDVGTESPGRGSGRRRAPPRGVVGRRARIVFWPAATSARRWPRKT